MPYKQLTAGMTKVKCFVQEWAKSCFSAIRILTASLKNLNQQEVLRRTLYFRFGVVAGVVTVSGIGSCILLRMPQMLLASLAALLADIFYMGYIEQLNAENLLFYLPAKCMGSQKILKAVRKTLNVYHFQGIGDDSDVSFSLNRTEEIGFVENIPYLFCFKKTEDGQIDNVNLVYYIELNRQAAAVAPTEDAQQVSIPSTSNTAEELRRPAIEFADDEEEE